MKNNTSEIRRILYELKKDYGFPLALYKKFPNSRDLTTGKMLLDEIKYPIRKAVVLPFSFFSKQWIPLQLRDFHYGGNLDVLRQIFIIDQHDIKDIVIGEQDNIIYAHNRYEIEKFDNQEYRQSMFLVGKLLVNTLAREQIDISLQDWINLTQSVIGTK